MSDTQPQSSPSASPSAGENPLAPLRARIDELDSQLIKLLNERAEVVVEIGRIKRGGHTTPIYAPDREKIVLQRILDANRGPLPDECLIAIWRELMSGSFALERALKIGYLGPAGSFSHLAAKRQFGACVEYKACDSISGVFNAVESKQIDLGLAPIENTIGGGIHETLDCFLDTSARVAAEVLLPVHHNLMADCPREDVKRVYSRPEVFEQCRQWLASNMGGVECVAMASSAKAAQAVADEENAAAIGSSLASEIYGLPIIEANIEDHADNVTRFFVIGHQSTPATGLDKTAILFTVQHKPGALAQVIDAFSRQGVNVTHIDKRPSKNINWEYSFFIDCEGHIDDEPVAAAIDDARKHCMQLTLLGSFPRAATSL
ncbi:MAG: prephenate dehydratase [Planctomycetota bacterium]|jgi:chorismate mutase/prephenate dehydratase